VSEVEEILFGLVEVCGIAERLRAHAREAEGLRDAMILRVVREWLGPLRPVEVADLAEWTGLPVDYLCAVVAGEPRDWVDDPMLLAWIAGAPRDRLAGVAAVIRDHAGACGVLPERDALVG
jgi:hypothetical protein